MSVPAAAAGDNALSQRQSRFTAAHQALAIPELLEWILSYVFAIPLRSASMPWMAFHSGPSDIDSGSSPSPQRFSTSQGPPPRLLPANYIDGYHPAIVPCHVAYHPARLVCRRWNVLYVQMSCLRFTRWTMKRCASSRIEEEAAVVKTRRKGPRSDLQDCQRIELVVHREPYGYERDASATIACRRLQWENLLGAMRDQNSCKSKGSRWNLDGEQSSKSSDEEEEEDETILSEPTSTAARSTRPHSSHWRRWTGASIHELCFRATGAVDTYLHDMLRLSQVNRSVTLIDIRFNVAIQFNLHILLVDFNNGGDDDHDSSNHNNRHCREAGAPTLLPNLQHLIVHGAILREPSTLLSSNQLADQLPITIVHSSPLLDDNGYDPVDSRMPFDAFFLPRKLRPLRRRRGPLDHDHDDDDDDGGEDPMLIKRKLQTFRLSNCDISKAYLFKLLRHLDRRHLRSLALNNLYRRYRQSQPQNTWSTVPLAFFGCSAYPMNMIDFAGILQTTQLESQLMQSRPRLQLRDGDRRTNSHVVSENPLAAVVAAALATGVQDGTGGRADGGQIEQSSEMQHALNRFRKMNADSQHLTRRFPNLQDISLHASTDRDIHPLDALLLLRAHIFPEPDPLSISGGGDKDRHFNDQNESVSVDCWAYSHGNFLHSFLINRSLTRLEITGTSVASLHGDPAMERLVTFLCSDQARNLVEFIAPKLYYPVEFVTPPPMDDDTDEDEDDDTEDEDEEALSMDGMGDEVLDSDNEEEANGQAVVIEPVHQDPKTVDGSLLRQRSSSTSNALKARLSRYVQRLVHYRSSTTTDCVKGSPKWTMANKTMANKSKKNHKKKKSQTRSKFWTSLFSPATNMSCSNLPPRVWACGSTLKRLELSFTSRFDGGWTRASSTRAVFGFLVTTLPNLHHLVVRQEYGVLAIDGGLCLLTRLRHLQQLEIQIRQFRHWAARYNDKLPIITSSTTSIFPPSSKQRLNHEKQEHQCGGGENAVHNKPHLLTWLQSDPPTIPTPTRRTKNIVSKDHVGHEQQQQPQRQQHTKNQQHPPGTSSLAIARRVALLDHRGGHFAKGAGRAMLWEKPPSSSSAAAAATTPFSSSSSSPSPSPSPSPSSQATTPQTHGCSWLQMRRITIKYEHGLSDDVHALQDDFYAVRPDITLSCNFIPWSS